MERRYLNHWPSSLRNFAAHSSSQPVKSLLVSSIQIPNIPQTVQCRRRVAEGVAGGGEAFGLGGVDDGDDFSDDLLGVVVEFHAHFVVEFLAGLDVEVVNQGLPLGGGFRLVRIPEVQGFAAMPDGDAAIGVRAADKPITMASQS